jgi:SAM-dependent methyltransferase
MGWLASPSALAAASFRDPSGVVFRLQDRIYRIANQTGWDELKIFLDSPAASRLLQNGSVVGSRLLDAPERLRLLADPYVASLNARVDGTVILEHERIPFQSFPYEWPPEMLHAAGRLTLDIALELSAAGLGLKDASPYNVLFRGPRPVFIDVLSFEPRQPGDPTWLPHAQFVRTFVLPLLVNKLHGTPIAETLITRRDGLEPDDVYRSLSLMDRLRPACLPLVSIPHWLGSRRSQDDLSIYRKQELSDPEKARFVLEHLLGRTRRSLDKLAPNSARNSKWSDYQTVNNNYTERHFQAKERFVNQALQEFQPRKALDVGCNTGHFSAMAARAGAAVVAIDYDPVVAGNVWRMAAAQQLDILPLVVDLTRPTPGTGWLNRECPSFLDRAHSHFDAVLMLAVIHHMLVTERVPLEEILKLAAGLTRNIAIVEFVGPGDSMFKRLARGRDHLHTGLTVEAFERAAAPWFEIVRSEQVEGTHRRLYVLRVRP